MRPIRRYVAVVIFLLLCVIVPANGQSSSSTDESAAAVMVERAFNLISSGQPQQALFVLDKVKAEYSHTHQAKVAEFRRAQAYEKLEMYDKALDTAFYVVKNNPGKVLACWGQCVLGSVLVKKDRIEEGIKALLKVEQMLPNREDMGPVGEAEGRLWDVCKECLNEESKLYSTLKRMPISIKKKKWVLDTLSAWLCERDNADVASDLWKKLAPGENPPPETAAKIMLDKAHRLAVPKKPKEKPDPQGAIELLDKLVADYPETEAAQWADFRRAEAYEKLGEYDQALKIAKGVMERHPGTKLASWAQCVAGTSWVKAGQVVEGIRTLLKVEETAVDKDDSGPTRQSWERLFKVCEWFLAEESVTAVALRKIPASQDKELLLASLSVWLGRMDKPVMAFGVLDRYCVSNDKRESLLHKVTNALAEMDKTEQAVWILEESENVYPIDYVPSERKRLDLLRVALRAAKDEKRFYCHVYYLIHTMMSSWSDVENYGADQAHEEFVSDVVSIAISVVNDNSIQAQVRYMWAQQTASCCGLLLRYRDAINILRQFIASTEVESDLRARSRFYLADYYIKIGYLDSARSCLRAINRELPRSEWSRKASYRLSDI